jgi:hypothetical protein
MKPFNLEAALRGEKVVTRDGRGVSQLIQFVGVDHPVALWGVVDAEDRPFSWYLDGIHNAIINPSPLDLFMYEEPAIWKPSACCSLRLVEKDIDGIKHRRLQQMYVNKLKPEYEWRDVPIVQEDPDV